MAKEIKARTHRTQMDAVTGKLETTELTPVQKALEKCVAAIDGQMLKLSNAESQELARRLLERVKKMLPSDEAEAA